MGRQTPWMGLFMAGALMVPVFVACDETDASPSRDASALDSGQQNASDGATEDASTLDSGQRDASDGVAEDAAGHEAGSDATVDGGRDAGEEDCDAGACGLPLDPPECLDTNSECTEYTCAPVTGCRVVDLEDGTDCADGDGGCQHGYCVKGYDEECDEGNPCTINARDPETDECEATDVPDGTLCSANNGVCHGGECTLGCLLDEDCDGVKNPCSANTCNSTTGECETATAEDGTPCPGGTCQHGCCVAD